MPQAGSLQIACMLTCWAYEYVLYIPAGTQQQLYIQSAATRNRTALIRLHNLAQQKKNENNMFGGWARRRRAVYTQTSILAFGLQTGTRAYSTWPLRARLHPTATPKGDRVPLHVFDTHTRPSVSGVRTNALLTTHQSNYQPSGKRCLREHTAVRKSTVPLPTKASDNEQPTLPASHPPVFSMVPKTAT